MTRFKKCEALYCDFVAKKIVKLYVEDTENKIGGWRDKQDYKKAYMTSQGLAVPKIKKHFKAHVCDRCFQTATPEDFYFQDGRKVARVER